MPQPARRRRKVARSLQFRLTFWYVSLLALAAGILLIFINAAAHLAGIPIETRLYPDPTTGFVYSQQVVNGAVASARAQTLERLQFFSILGFLVLIFLGAAVGSIVAGRALRPISELVGVARRISGRNLKERIALDNADEELRQLGDAFNDMVARLDDAFERQRQFVADASHELRTPLTTLQIALDSVRLDPDASLEDYRTVADDAKAATVRIHRLVEDLLALAEGDAPLPRSRVDLSSLAEAVVEEMEPLGERRGVQVVSTVSPGTVILGDPLSLRRALTNLVENGIRYNRDGGHVIVEDAGQSPDWVQVAVRDDGIGIAAEEHKKVFDRFYRVDRSRSRAEGGSGLGLAIVTKIAAEHGGRVDLQSQPGVGSRFVLTLPASRRTAVAAPLAPASSATG
ncbi:MAG TPA: ATP-binding protein [Candidatus Dormibacteraeota bacterium]